MEHGKSHLQDGNTRSKDEGTSSRILKDTKHKSGLLEGNERPNSVKSVHTVSDQFLSKVKHRRSKNDMGTKGKFMENVEVLSSDHSSDDSLQRHLQFPPKMLRKQSTTKPRNCRSRGMPTDIDVPSPSRSRESSHLLSYSYEEESNSLDKKAMWLTRTFQNWDCLRTGEEIKNNEPYCNSDTPKI